MIRTLLLHPATTFAFGLLVAIALVAILLAACASPNKTAESLATYRQALTKAGAQGPAPATPEERAALERFTNFLTNLHDPTYIRQHTRETYAADAYLSDTLVTHHGAAEIEAYFLKTSAAMTRYEVSIDDIARSGPDIYVRWTMVFAAPALSGGTPVHSTGISQIRLDATGKIAFHQDFWDSGANFFGQAPVAGSVIEFIRKRLE
jgi:hypothetical protein